MLEVNNQHSAPVRREKHRMAQQHPLVLECAGRAQRRRRVWVPGTFHALQSGVALRLPPHYKVFPGPSRVVGKGEAFPAL